jgi:hypothetical protein
LPAGVLFAIGGGEKEEEIKRKETKTMRREA